MQFLDTIKIATQAIKTNIVRTVITCCIIGIGIMALVCILTSVDGLKMYLSNSFSAMGANSFKIRNTSLSFNLDGEREAAKVFKPIAYNEAVDFKNKFNQEYATSVQYLANGASTIKYKDKKTNPNITVLGTDENYINNEGYSLYKGRNFTTSELDRGDNTIILGYTVAQKIFGNKYTLDNTFVKLDDLKFKVVGVLNEKGSSLITTDDIVIP
ncbi:MAG: ABC transporter permease [Chitinophagales bacterium]